MEEPKLKVKVTAYESSLIIETQEFEKDGNFIPCGNGNLGCVVIDTEKFLGMSQFHQTDSGSLCSAMQILSGLLSRMKQRFSLWQTQY